MMVARYFSCYRAIPFSKNFCADFPLLHSCHSIAVQCFLSYFFFLLRRCCLFAVPCLLSLEIIGLLRFPQRFACFAAVQLPFICCAVLLSLEISLASWLFKETYIFFYCAVAVQLLCHVSSAWRLLVCCVFHKDLLVLLLCNCHSFAVQFSSAWRSAWLLGFLKKPISFFTVQLLCNCCAMSPHLGDFWFSTNICLFCCCAIAIHLLCSSPQLGDQPVLCICCANI